MIAETVILLQCGGSSTNRGAGMANNIRIVHYLQSASNHFPCLISSHTDGFAHTTCVGQWNTSKCNLSKGLKIACVLWLALSCSSGKCCDYYHEKEPRLVFLTTRDVHMSHLYCPIDILSQQVRKAILDHIALAESPADHNDQPNHPRQELPKQPIGTPKKCLLFKATVLGLFVMQQKLTGTWGRHSELQVCLYKGGGALSGWLMHWQL